MTPEEKVALLKEAGVWDVIGFPTCVDRLFDLVAEKTSIEQQREIVRLNAIIQEQANGAQNLVLAERERIAASIDVEEYHRGSWFAREIRSMK